MKNAQKFKNKAKKDKKRKKKIKRKKVKPMGVWSELKRKSVVEIYEAVTERNVAEYIGMKRRSGKKRNN